MRFAVSISENNDMRINIYPEIIIISSPHRVESAKDRLEPLVLHLCASSGLISTSVNLSFALNGPRPGSARNTNLPFMARRFFAGREPSFFAVVGNNRMRYCKAGKSASLNASQESCGGG